MDRREVAELENGSSIEAITAGSSLGQNSDSNAFRGGTYSFVLMSELAFYEHGPEKFYADAKAAMAKVKGAMFVVESTFRTGGFVFKSLWENAVAGKNDLSAKFVSLLDHPIHTEDPNSISDIDFADLKQRLKFKDSQRDKAAFFLKQLRSNYR